MQRLRSILTAGALALAASIASACAPSALVALPSNASEWVDSFAARATSRGGVTVEARTRGFKGAALEGVATPVLLRVENGGKVPLRIRRDAFQLVAGTAEFHALPPDQIGVPRPEIHRGELRAKTLDPGEATSGLIYFEPVVGQWGFIHLRTMLVDASTDALVDSVDVPFSSGYLAKCTLELADRREPRTSENILFHGCLPAP